MKSQRNQTIIDSMIDELTSWSVQLKIIEKQLDQHQKLSHDSTAKLSCIVGQLEELNQVLEHSELLDNELLISCFAFCVSHLNTVYTKLYDQSKNILLDIMVSNAHHDYKLDGLTEMDFYQN